jgi:hypothetical protein
MKSDGLPIDSEDTKLNPDDEYDTDLIAEAEAVVAAYDETPDPRPAWEIELEEILGVPDISEENPLTGQKTPESEYDRGFFDGVRFAQKTPKYISLDLAEAHGKEETEDFFRSLEDIINKFPTIENEKIDSLNPQVKFCWSGDTIIISDFSCGPDPLNIAVRFTQNRRGGIPRLVPTCTQMDEIHYLKSRDSESREVEISHNNNVLYMERETGQFIFHTTSTDARLYGPERAEFLYMQTRREIGVFMELLEKKS